MRWFSFYDLDAQQRVLVNLSSLVWVSEAAVEVDVIRITAGAIDGEIHRWRVGSNDADRLARVLEMATEAP